MSDSIDDVSPVPGASRLPELLETLLGALAQRLAGPGATSEHPQDHAKLRRLTSFLAQQNRRMADMFGACICWGSDARCRWCAGRGSPGFRTPDIDLLKQLVLEACHDRPRLITTLTTDLAEEMTHE